MDVSQMKTSRDKLGKKNKDKGFEITDAEVEHLKRTKYAPYIQTEMQTRMMDQSKRLEGVLDQLDITNQGLRDEVYEVEHELEMLEKEKAELKNPFPGRKMQKEIEKM